MYLRNLDLKTWPQITSMAPETFFSYVAVQLVYHHAKDKRHEAVCREWKRFEEGIVFDTEVEKMFNDHRRIPENNQIVFELLKRWKGEGSQYLKDVALPEPYNPYHTLILALHRWWCQMAEEGAFKANSDFFTRIKKEFSVAFREHLLPKYKERAKNVDTWMELVPFGKEIFSRVYKDFVEKMTPKQFVQEIRNPWSNVTKEIRRVASNLFDKEDQQVEDFASSYMAGFLVRFWEHHDDNCPVMLSFSFDPFYDAEGNRWSSFEQFIWDSIKDHRSGANFVPLMVFYIRACFNMGYYKLEDVEKWQETPFTIEETIQNFIK